MGTLIVNLQSLEFALRAFLHNCETGSANHGEPTFLENITEGQQLAENAFTNYDALRDLIDKYNNKIRPTNPDLEVDPGITRIRDALAHGRIASQSPLANAPQRLVKYARPKHGLVRVTDCYTLTKEWFDEKIRLVAESVRRVARAMTLFQ